MAKKLDGSINRRKAGRPRLDLEIQDLIIRFAQENPGWGYDRIVGVLSNLGYEISDQKVGNVLKRNGILPAPERKKDSNWAAFIKAHENILTACDFFTTEVITPAGLVTYYILFFIHIGSRKVYIAGATPNPDKNWMKQMARNITMADWGFLNGYRYLIHDRDSKFCDSFRESIRSSGVESLKLPAKSPNLNSYAERFVLSIKSECLSKLIFFGEQSLTRVLGEYITHYHAERNHQGKGNVLLLPPQGHNPPQNKGTIIRRSRIDGMLNYYYRKAGIIETDGYIVINPV
ncbi:MAG: integrase core domain-containing protein [bacterium]